MQLHQQEKLIKLLPFMAIKIIACVCLLFIGNAFAKPQVLNIYSWTGYLPNQVLQQFTKETGIKVNLAEYDSNETMYAKLKASAHAGYDIVIPSADFVQRMAQQGMLHKIDKSKIPNLKNLNPSLLNKPFDPNNTYSVPYLWGSLGIVVNANYIDPQKAQYWKDFWQPQFKNELMMLSDIRDVFAVALLVLGYSINDQNPDHIKQAYLKLKELLPNIKIFNTDAEQTIYIDEDAIIGMGYNGDIHLTQQENNAVTFVYPKDGFAIWIDSLAITKNAPHLDNAHKFINFLLRADIAKDIFLNVGYASPNLAALKLLDKKTQNNPIINPDSATLARGQFEQDLGAARPLYEHYWELLKIGA